MTFVPERRKAPIFDIEKATSVLHEAKDALDSLGLESFLLFGTCLGAVRHGGFIPWDYDIDLGVFGLERLPEIKSELTRRGFIQKSMGKDHYKYFPGTKDGVLIDIHPYTIENDMMQTYVRFNETWLAFPKKFYPKDTITFYGRQFLIPSPAEEYLEWTYGDWRTPSEASANGR